MGSYLEMPRLTIRPFTMEDFDALWEIFGDPVVMEHVAPYTEEETREFLRTFCVERDRPGPAPPFGRRTGGSSAIFSANRSTSPASTSWAGFSAGTSGGGATPMRRSPP